jgi:selenide, water dikinase
MRLTEAAKSAGCAGKLGPKELALALRDVPHQRFPEVLVGYDNSDDAGVYQLSPDLALVQTVDYFPPIVDDPYTFGRIAAANALSDVYAMGGQPKTALSIVGFPALGVDFSILGQIMTGGISTLNEAGVALLGGHSVRDDEIKFGYAITGVIDPKKVKQNNGAKPDDRVFLSKPLGTGLITTALKRGKAAPDHVQAAVDAMLQLNRTASEIALQLKVDTMTDVTGFSLIGHAQEVARASDISIHIDHRKLRLLPGALEYSRGDFTSAGLHKNREFFGPQAAIADSVPLEIQNILFDPQTSGGLLIFCQPDDGDSLLKRLCDAGLAAFELGTTSKRTGPLLTVT